MELPQTEQELTELPLDDLAMRLLPKLANQRNGLINRSSYGDQSFLSRGLGIALSSHAAQHTLLEAYDWLLVNGLIAFDPHQYGSWAYVTARGRKLLDDPRALESIRAARRIELDLHPLIATRVRRQFTLGEYESAVFLAFRKVEIRVRDLGGYDNSEIGIRLMKKAFNPGHSGPLVDNTLDPGEQESMMFLFAGAIGAFKNPSSHRQVDYGDATVAAEAVLLADLLLRMLDKYDAVGPGQESDAER